jgi:adenosylmethionine-8-amino-7-oxononanoate aminotransferase
MTTETALWPLLTPFAQHGDDAFCAVSAEGVRVRFADGTEKLCGTSGLWNVNLGYGNAAVAEAAARALREASYLTVWGFENRWARSAADALVGLAGRETYARVVFATSGGSANDAAMKLARHWQALRDRGGRKIVLGLKGGYHGLTFGAFALSDVALGKAMYGVDRTSVGHVPADPAALRAVLREIGGRIAAIVVEPVIGKGAIPLSTEFLHAIFEGRQEHDYLVVADEITTGFGRVGPHVFASRTWPAQPDVLLTGKAMTNGTQAASALLISHRVFEAFQRRGALFAHAETQAGTPVVAASVLATVAEMERLSALALGERLSRALDGALRALVGRTPLVVGTRGAGCMRSLTLSWPDGSELSAADVDAAVEAVRRAGALVHPGPSCLLLLPALIYTTENIDQLLACISEGVSRLSALRLS